MEQLIMDVIKYATMFFSIVYVYVRLLRITPRASWALHLPICLALAVLVHYIVFEYRYLIPVNVLLFSFVYLLIAYKKPIRETLPYSIVAVGMSFFILTISYIVTLPLTIAFALLNNESLALIIMTVFCAVVQATLTLLLFKIKKFKNGIVAVKSETSFLLLVFISLLTICLVTAYYTKFVHSYLVFVIIVIVAIVGFLLISLWRIVLANRYKSEITKRNVKIYEQTLAEYKSQNDMLHDNNDKLSAIIHRDNKLLTTIEIAINELLKRQNNSPEITELQNTISQLSSQRGKLVKDYSNDLAYVPTTNVIAIDATLLYIHSLTQKNNIALYMNVDENFSQAIASNNINLIELNALLCDLCENAIHAVDGINDAKIKLTLSIRNGCPCITIFDNGVEFDEKVLSNLGKIKITTRKNQGGSGIGLVYIFEILQRYLASFCLDENLQGEYTKAITVTFDNLGELKINTARPQIAKIFKNRNSIF